MSSPFLPSATQLQSVRTTPQQQALDAQVEYFLTNTNAFDFLRQLSVAFRSGATSTYNLNNYTITTPTSSSFIYVSDNNTINILINYLTNTAYGYSYTVSTTYAPVPLTWNYTTAYTKNQVVVYAGINYICNQNPVFTITGTTIATDLTYPNCLSLANLTVTAASSDGTTATLSFSSQANTPFVVGQTITVSAMGTSAFNGNWVVTNATQNYVQFTGVSGIWPSAATTVYGTVSGTTVPLLAGMPITFSQTGSGIVSTNTYYVKTILDNTHFTVSSGIGGSTLPLSATTTGLGVTATMYPPPSDATYWSPFNPSWTPVTQGPGTAITTGAQSGSYFILVAWA